MKKILLILIISILSINAQAQTLFGFKYVFKINTGNAAYFHDAGDTTFNGFAKIFTPMVKRGTTIIPAFSMGCNNTGTIACTVTTTTTQTTNANGDVTTITITNDGVNPVTTKKVVTTIQLNSGIVAPAIVPSLGTITNAAGTVTTVNNGITTTTTTITNPSPLAAPPLTLTGTFTAITNGVSTNLTINLGVIPVSVNVSVATAYHAAYSGVNTDGIKRRISYTITNPNTAINPNPVWPDGKNFTGTFADTIDVPSGITIYQGTFTAAITNYSSDISAASHYTNELVFHPYKFITNTGKAVEYTPAAGTVLIQDQYTNRTYYSTYNVIYSMTYINDAGPLATQYTHVPYFDLSFRSGYLGAITIPLSYSCGVNAGWSTSSSTLLNGGFSVGGVWGHTVFYKDENITPVNRYGGIGGFMTFSTATIPLAAFSGPNPSGTATTTSDVATLFGINGIYHFLGIDFILAVGEQFALGTNSSFWGQQGSLWAGVGIGFNVLKLATPNGAW